jgi:hypothetical protein
LGGAFMSGPDACVPVTGTPVTMSLRDLARVACRARGRCRGRLLSQRRNGPHPPLAGTGLSAAPARDPSTCAAHSSRRLAESGAGQPCRPRAWPHTDHPGLAGRIRPVRRLTMHTGKADTAPAARACQRPQTERTARSSPARAVRRQVNTPPGNRVRRRRLANGNVEVELPRLEVEPY